MVGKAKRKKHFDQYKRIMSPKDERALTKQQKEEKEKEKQKEEEKSLVRDEKISSSLFFRYNTSLGPPYHVLVDTNFINFSVMNKLDLINAMMDCLYAKYCVMAELEKLGPKYRVALRIAKDERFERLPCTHQGTYADDCIVRRIQMVLEVVSLSDMSQHKCYIVATCDRDLKRRIRKIPGVPIMYIKSRRYTIERMPEAYGAPAL